MHQNSFKIQTFSTNIKNYQKDIANMKLNNPRKKTKNYKRNLIHCAIQLYKENSQVSNITLNNVIDLSKRKTIKDLFK